MGQSVYIETTIVSYLMAWPSRDLVRAAHQRTTREWWDTERPKFDVFTSELVRIEAAAGDSDAAAERLAILDGIAQLEITAQALELADALIAASALPPIAERDSVHVGIAAVHGIEFLPTWNCRHLANALLRDRIEEVCEDAGFQPPKICTPEELLEMSDDRSLG